MGRNASFRSDPKASETRTQVVPGGLRTVAQKPPVMTIPGRRRDLRLGLEQCDCKHTSRGGQSGGKNNELSLKCRVKQAVLYSRSACPMGGRQSLAPLSVSTRFNSRNSPYTELLPDSKCEMLDSPDSSVRGWRLLCVDTPLHGVSCTMKSSRGRGSMMPPSYLSCCHEYIDRRKSFAETSQRSSHRSSLRQERTVCRIATHRNGALPDCSSSLLPRIPSLQY